MMWLVAGQVIGSWWLAAHLSDGAAMIWPLARQMACCCWVAAHPCAGAAVLWLVAQQQQGCHVAVDSPLGQAVRLAAEPLSGSCGAAAALEGTFLLGWPAK